MSDQRCHNCKYRESRNLCGSPQSPNYKQTVQPEWKCDFFNLSQAQEAFGEALVALASQDEAKAVEYMKKAIELGLPEDDEISARSWSSAAYVTLAMQVREQLKLTPEQFVRLPEYIESVNEMEKALAIDKQGNYQYFFEPLHRAGLRDLDLGYDRMGDSLKKTQGIDSAIGFFQEKAGIVSYLPTTPLLVVMESLGDMYAEKGQKENAASCYSSVVNSEPVKRGDEQEFERSIRQEAAEKLSRLKVKARSAASPEPAAARKPSSETASPNSGLAAWRRLIYALSFVTGALIAYGYGAVRPSSFNPFAGGSPFHSFALAGILASVLVTVRGARNGGWRAAVMWLIGTGVALQALLWMASLNIFLLHTIRFLSLENSVIWGAVYSLSIPLFIRHLLYFEGGHTRVATKWLAASVGLLALGVFLTSQLSTLSSVHRLLRTAGLVPPLLTRFLHFQ